MSPAKLEPPVRPALAEACFEHAEKSESLSGFDSLIMNGDAKSAVGMQESRRGPSGRTS